VDIPGQKIKVVKLGGVTVLVLLLLFAALGPGKWQYRTGLGWQTDHLVGYFVFTLGFWFAWPRPFVVLQALTPDRHCDFQGALYSAAGALAAALTANLFTRALPRLNARLLLLPQVPRPSWRRGLVRVTARPKP
jgi:formate hydrogenlyase subunit 3/multisubunit Na+/H+ antiporter MnhD subunit